MTTPLADFTYEQALKRKYPSTLFLGVDEAGRGPLAGPVVAAAACYKREDYLIPEALEKQFAFIRDSKTISEKKREEMFALIQEHFHVGVGIIYPETIDRINILQATFLGMKEAVGSLRRSISQQSTINSLPESLRETLQAGQQYRHPDNGKVLLLIDGNQKLPNISLPQETVVSGDKIVKTIAAASIIAKVTRDRMMNEYDAKYPQYGFKKHKGYGTKVHMEALKTYGPTPIHRISFAPVAQAVLWFKELGIIRD
ncbi:MAG: ribonuclease HII [Candidatus Moranbacteria bacterium]|nr:ribonuclease HII [Candidatus Moranbacteria bacterium]